MAIEAKRGCGYRKVGGLYLVGGLLSSPCDRLPFELTVCPTCSCGIKQARGWTWVDVPALFGGNHSRLDNTLENNCQELNTYYCPLCRGVESIGKAGLLWIGNQFYKTPEEFLAEGRTLGISRRIRTIPRGFEVGKTWVLLAHPKAVKEIIDVAILDGKETTKELVKYKPGIFSVFRPSRIETLITETQSKDAEYVESLTKRGLTIIVVPDGDVDHRGTVYDKEPEAELFEAS